MRNLRVLAVRQRTGRRSSRSPDGDDNQGDRRRRATASKDAAEPAVGTGLQLTRQPLQLASKRRCLLVSRTTVLREQSQDDVFERCRNMRIERAWRRGRVVE